MEEIYLISLLIHVGLQIMCSKWCLGLRGFLNRTVMKAKYQLFSSVFPKRVINSSIYDSSTILNNEKIWFTQGIVF